MYKSGSFLASTLRIGLSGAGAQAVVFLSLPLLTRLYTTESFGLWALLQSTALLIGAVATCRYELAVVLPETDAIAASVLGVGMVTSMLVTLIAAVALPHLDPTLLGGTESFSMALWAVPMMVLLTAMIQLALAWGIRTAAFTLYGSAQLCLAVLSATLPLFLANPATGALGLVTGTLLANAIVAIALWIWLGRRLYRNKLLNKLSWKNLWAAGRQYRNYPLYMTPYTILGTIRDRLVYFLLGQYAGSSNVGLYAIAQRLTNAPNSLAASALRPVFFQRVAQGDPTQVTHLVAKVMLWLCLLSIPPIVFFFFYPERIIELLFGSEWAGSSSYVMILTIPMLPLLLGNWMDRYFDALGRQRLAFAMEFVFTVIAVGTLATAFQLGANPILAVALQAAVMTVYFTTWILVLFHIVNIPITVFLGIVRNALLSAFITTIIIGALSRYAGFWPTFGCFLLVWSASLFMTWRVQQRHTLHIPDP